MERIIDLFYQNAELRPDKIAIWCDGKTKTYKELEQMVGQYSEYLLTNGVAYKDHIGLPMNNSIESAALMLTAANIGAALVPINPTLPQEAIRTAFRAGCVKHLIARKAFLDRFEEQGAELTDGKIICLDGCGRGLTLEEAGKLKGERIDNSKVTGDETFIITLTSGSTGAPKPIHLTQRNKYERAVAHIKKYDLTENDRILAATPLYHSLAERLVLMPLMTGGTSILVPRFTPAFWLNCVKEQKVTFTIAVSAQLGQVAQLLSSPFVPQIDSLRCIVSSSAWLEPHVKSALISNLKCEFHEIYGTSEISTATDINFKNSVSKSKSVGRPLPGVSIKILDEAGAEKGTGAIGEICCKTPLVCSGYYGMQEEFRNACAGGYFKTGDLGYLDPDGYLYFTGRKKEVIITGGINVYPADVECCINEMEGVRESAAFSYPDERLGEVVAVAVVEKEEGRLKKRQIQVQCAKKLADYQQPHQIFFVKELPRNAMGKLVKGKLLEYVKLQARGDKPI